MKAIICEMCGSHDVIKKDGLYICESCGTKYSVEEAKKLLVDGLVDVSGSTIKIDTDEKLKNLMSLARSAKNDNNREMAEKYYGEVLLLAPQNWEAKFYSVYYAALNKRLIELPNGIQNLAGCCSTVFSQLKITVNDTKEQKEAYIEIADYIMSFNKMVFECIIKSGNPTDNAEKWGVPSLIMQTIYADELYLCFQDYDLANNMYTDAKKFSIRLAKSIPSMGAADRMIQEKINTMNKDKAQKEKEENERIAAEKQKKREQYWAEHKDEKEKLLQEKADLVKSAEQLNIDITNIRGKKDKITHLAEYRESTDQIRELTRRRDSLGIFKGKEKKLLSEQIKQLNERTENLRAKINEEEAVIDIELQPLMQKMNETKARIKGIETELTKDR